MIDKHLITKYFSLFLTSYITRFLFVRFVLSTESFKQFYYKREILPGVKNWSDRFLRSLYIECFGVLESFTVAFLFMLSYNFIPSYGFIKAMIFCFSYLFITIPVKLGFSIISTNYPLSLLALDIILSSVSMFIQCVLMWFFYIN